MSAVPASGAAAGLTPPGARDGVEMLALAALWGSVFLMIRLAVADFGVWSLAALRLGLGAICLLPVLLWRAQLRTALRSHWREISFIGVLNMALPALLFTFAAQHLTSGLIAILNSTSPLFAAAIGALWLHTALSRWQLAGLGLGFAGVVGLSLDGAGLRGEHAALGVAACLGAALCYGISVNYLHRHMKQVPSMAVIIGSLVVGTLLTLAPGVLNWPAADKSLQAWSAALFLGVAATSLGFVLYFRLIANIGATRAIAVTFLMPVFAMFWGWLFLAEPVNGAMLLCTLTIVSGTALSTGLLRPL